MDFVFDIDGTLCFDGMSLSKEIQGILERAQIDYGHRVTNYWFKWCDFT